MNSEDLLLNITVGSLGWCCIVPKEFDTGNVNQHVAIIRTVFPELGPFVHKSICSSYFQDEIINIQTGAGREGLSESKMDNILIARPSAEEQKVTNKILPLLVFSPTSNYSRDLLVKTPTRAAEKQHET